MLKQYSKTELDLQHSLPIAAFCYPYPLSDDLLPNQLQFIL
ncbi:hypothetical protein MCC93_06300 [Morococcus cerebrosus]|uniref:Uncharacterized protein n=1 Tax=Morococcus cerebrosus TaxID=1056807 RepID=A0A0C1H9X2_9NEIS|nr:hypothetical protein MCC93_06300 [Morococcus cerebrosus]